MKQNQDETSEGLNQIFEIINAKGDIGELEQIMDKTKDSKNQETNNPDDE